MKKTIRLETDVFKDIDDHYNADSIEIKVVGKGNYLLLENVLKNILKNIRYKHIESYIDDRQEDSVIHVFKPISSRRKQ